MLAVEKTAFIVVDVQEKLAKVMHNKEELFENLKSLIRGIRIMGIPIIWTEQNPAGMGPTVPEIAELLDPLKPISKLSFSCCRNERFMQALKATKRKQLLLAGIENHVCIYQTAMDLMDLGFHAEVVSDAVSSRTLENKKAGSKKMRDAGIGLTTVEISLFELLKVAEGHEFKEILKIVK